MSDPKPSDVIAPLARGDLDAALAEAERAVLDDPTSAEAFNTLGNVLFKRGDLSRAEVAYNEAISRDPSLFKPYTNLGSIAASRGLPAAAEPFFRNALARNPKSSRTRASLANALRDLGRGDEAIDEYQRSIAETRSHLACHNLAALFFQRGDTARAVSLFQQALALDPAAKETERALAIALDAEKAQTAAAERSLQESADGQAALRGAEALYASGLFADAEEVALKGLERAPEHPGLPEMVVAAAAADGQPNRAFIRLRTFALDAKSPLWGIRVLARLADWRPTDAYEFGRKLLLRFPGSSEIALGCAAAAFAIGRQGDALELLTSLRSWGAASTRTSLDLEARLSLFEGDHAKTRQLLTQAAALYPGDEAASSRLLMVSNYDPSLTPLERKEEHRRWGHKFEGLAPVSWKPRDRSADRPLVVGYVSADFRRHAVSSFLLPLIEAHDRSAVSLYCYNAGSGGDEVTKAYRSLPLTFREAGGISDEELAQRVAEDGVDVLVDLMGHTPKNRLLTFARRPAPIQVSYLGYPNTTGLSAMGYRIADVVADPPGSEAQFTEELVHLPGCIWSFRPIARARPIKCAPKRDVVFGSFNNFNKVTNETLQLWARIVSRVPRSSIYLKAQSLGFSPARARVLECFASYGVTSNRVRLEPLTKDLDDHMAAYGEVDVALDPLLYNGTTTTCEALFMGVPVVTMAGGHHASRVGASLVLAVGEASLATSSIDGYEKLAIELAADCQRRERLRRSLHVALAGGRLGDARALARDLEAAYRRLWRAWLSK